MDPDVVSVGERLHPGWRLLIWMAVFVGAMILVGLIMIKLLHPRQGAFLDPARLIAGDIFLTFIPALVATRVMATVEGRSFRDYYVPGRGFFARQFWSGLLWGVLSVSLLIGLIAMLGGYKIAGIATTGSSLWYWLFLWVAASLTIGVVEEFTFRAYMLRTLGDAVGFWPAAVLLSVGFGALHYFTKPYERWEDFASTGLLGLFMCFTIRRTGAISFAVGWHTAFDWGALYLYSGSNAGEFAKGHLLATSWPGPDRLTGGQLGPEASWFIFAVAALLFAAFAVASRRKNGIFRDYGTGASEGDLNSERKQQVDPQGEIDHPP
jgi:uncharacterized protein